MFSTLGRWITWALTANAIESPKPDGKSRNRELEPRCSLSFAVIGMGAKLAIDKQSF